MNSRIYAAFLLLMLSGCVHSKSKSWDLSDRHSEGLLYRPGSSIALGSISINDFLIYRIDLGRDYHVSLVDHCGDGTIDLIAVFPYDDPVVEEVFVCDNKGFKLIGLDLLNRMKNYYSGWLECAPYRMQMYYELGLVDVSYEDFMLEALGKDDNLKGEILNEKESSRQGKPDVSGL